MQTCYKPQYLLDMETKGFIVVPRLMMLGFQEIKHVYINIHNTNVVCCHQSFYWYALVLTSVSYGKTNMKAYLKYTFSSNCIFLTCDEMSMKQQKDTAKHPTAQGTNKIIISPRAGNQAPWCCDGQDCRLAAVSRLAGAFPCGGVLRLPLTVQRCAS